MPDAHLAHQGDAIGGFAVHGPAHSFPGGHASLNISTPGGIVKKGEGNSSSKSPQKVIDPLFT
jgi:hypothetical protein